MVEERKDVVVIGGGPAGYVAAIRAAQAGASTALIERSVIGGTCLNVGCISTKVLAKTAEILTQTQKLDSFGIRAENISLDYETVQARKKQAVEYLTNGVSVLLDHNGVEYISGDASFKSAGQVEIKTSEGKSLQLNSRNVILAAGSRPMEIPVLPFDGEAILDSSGLLSLDQLPKSLLIVGGGVIGVEFASIMAQFGVQVCLVEMLPKLVPFLDHEISEAMQYDLEAKGIDIYTNTKVVAADIEKDSVTATLDNKNGEKTVKVDKVLVSAGRVPNVEELNLDKVGVVVENGAVKVNSKMETSVSGIYAAGDICGGSLLASKAYHEASVAAANCTGATAEININAMPYCIFTNPEIAGCGLSEEQARQEYDELIVERFPFSANGKALASGVQSGFVKVIIEPRHHEILGFFILGPSATELIHQASQAMRMEGVLDDLADMIYGHPTLSEVIGEVAMIGLKKPLHMV